MSDIKINKKSNTRTGSLQLSASKMPEEPNLMREFFSTPRYQRISFNFRRNPLGMPKGYGLPIRPSVTDREPYTVEQTGI